jgi:hypothetical protein
MNKSLCASRQEAARLARREHRATVDVAPPSGVACLIRAASV